MDLPLTLLDDRAILTVRLTPNARDDRIEGLRQLADGKTVLAVRVRAIPEDGAANAGLEKLIAEIAGVAKSHVAVTGGQTQRVKTLTIRGRPEVIETRLKQAVGAT